jgi:hypothetical protein
MVYSPHTLQVKAYDSTGEVNEFGQPVSASFEWRGVGECRCDDNTTLDRISVEGELFVYAYHIVYKNGGIKASDWVRAIDAENGTVRGEGRVVKASEPNDFECADLWI